MPLSSKEKLDIIKGSLNGSVDKPAFEAIHEAEELMAEEAAIQEESQPAKEQPTQQPEVASTGGSAPAGPKVPHPSTGSKKPHLVNSASSMEIGFGQASGTSRGATSLGTDGTYKKGGEYIDNSSPFEISMCSNAEWNGGSVKTACGNRNSASNLYGSAGMTIGSMSKTNLSGSVKGGLGYSSHFPYSPMTGHAGLSAGTRFKGDEQSMMFNKTFDATGSVGVEGELGGNSYNWRDPWKYGAGIYGKQDLVNGTGTTAGVYGHLGKLSGKVGYNKNTGIEATLGFGLPIRQTGGFQETSGSNGDTTETKEKSALDRGMTLVSSKRGSDDTHGDYTYYIYKNASRGSSSNFRIYDTDPTLQVAVPSTIEDVKPGEEWFEGKIRKKKKKKKPMFDNTEIEKTHIKVSGKDPRAEAPGSIFRGDGTWWAKKQKLLKIKPISTQSIPRKEEEKLMKAIPLKLGKGKHFTLERVGQGTHTYPKGDDGLALVRLKDQAGRRIFEGSQEEYLEQYGEHLSRGTSETQKGNKKTRLYKKKKTGGFNSSYQKGGYKNYEVPKQKEQMSYEELLRRQRFQESSFKHDAVSPKGATGVAQIMPDTLDYAKMKGWVPKSTTMKDLKTYDIAEKIQINYMNNLIDREWVNGSETVKRAKALIAYNWGPKNTFNKLTELKKAGVDIYSDDLNWLSHFNEESRGYVERVLQGKGDFEEQYKKGLKDNIPLKMKHGGFNKSKMLYNKASSKKTKKYKKY